MILSCPPPPLKCNVDLQYFVCAWTLQVEQNNIAKTGEGAGVSGTSHAWRQTALLSHLQYFLRQPNQRIIFSYLFLIANTLFRPRLCRGLCDPETCSRPASSRPASFSGALLAAAAVAACPELHSCREMDYVSLSQQTWAYLSPPHRAAAYWTIFAYTNQRKIEGPCRPFGLL